MRYTRQDELPSELPAFPAAWQPASGVAEVVAPENGWGGREGGRKRPAAEMAPETVGPDGAVKK